MKKHNKALAALSLIAAFFLSLLSGCSAEAPNADSVQLLGTDKNGAILYCVSIYPGSVTVWYTDGEKSDSGEVALPSEISDIELAKSGITAADINSDGCTDLLIPRESQDSALYSFVLMNNGDNTFSVNEKISDLPNIGIDGSDFYSDKDCGLFGIRRTVYRISDEEYLIVGSEYTLDTFSVVKGLSKELFGLENVTVEHPEMNDSLGIVYGRICVDGTYCTVYTVSADGQLKSLFALSDEGEWLVDSGAVGSFSKLSQADGVLNVDSAKLPVTGKAA